MARKLLNGSELAGFIKQRQARQVRALRQAHGVAPRLVIVQSQHANQVITTYVRMKQRYAADILVDTELIVCEQSKMAAAIARANDDPLVHGIMVQLPLDDTSTTQTLLDTIAPKKDVDGLGSNAEFTSATAEAIDWLLAGYGVQLADKKITLLGNGKLVGAPLAAMWTQQGHAVEVVDASRADQIDGILSSSQIIVSATGTPRLLHNDNVPQGAVVVDAGTVSEDGQIVGDAALELQVRRDLTITPPKGGVGPLTVVLLFDHVIRAALTQAGVTSS